MDRSITAEVAFNMLVFRQNMKVGQAPCDMYDASKLKAKDAGRPRFHVLLREPSPEEVMHPIANLYTIKKGPLVRKLMIRIRTVQGHSGARKAAADRIGQRMMPKTEYPLLLMHSTLEKCTDQFKQQGLPPGGYLRLRNDKYLVDPSQFV